MLNNKIKLQFLLLNNNTYIKKRFLSTNYNFPITANELPRPSGINTMCRLPLLKSTEGLDVCFLGVALDQGTSNRPGTRFGPRQIRQESVLIRGFNKDTGASPFDSLCVADIGDVNISMYDIVKSCDQITEAFIQHMKSNCKILAIGGDHTITYPILRAVKNKYGPVALIHIDAHLDVNEHMNNCLIAHGTPFRRAFEDGCLIPEKVFQIGIRGSGVSVDDSFWPISKGFNVITAAMCYHKSLIEMMNEIKKKIGTKTPVYISFDIDALDPCYAPGTGTPEIAGLTTIQALEIIRGCKNLNIIGGDLVEVAPMYDPSGNTALTAANLLFEMLCIFPNVKYL